MVPSICQTCDLLIDVLFLSKTNILHKVVCCCSLITFLICKQMAIKEIQSNIENVDVIKHSKINQFKQHIRS